MRVTIAASGQGRFKEELSFPYEAKESGMTPILVVFDETESALLTKLKAQFKHYGGKCFVGQAAWDMLYVDKNDDSIIISDGSNQYKIGR